MKEGKGRSRGRRSTWLSFPAAACTPLLPGSSFKMSINKHGRNPTKRAEGGFLSARYLFGGERVGEKERASGEISPCRAAVALIGHNQKSFFFLT
jgi:hypothetical protein